MPKRSAGWPNTVERDLPPLWHSPQWKAEFESRLCPALADSGLTVAGPLVQERVRFCTTVPCCPSMTGSRSSRDRPGRSACWQSAPTTFSPRGCRHLKVMSGSAYPFVHKHCGTRPRDRKTPAGQGFLCGRYRDRTDDLFRVREARYRCANRPYLGRVTPARWRWRRDLNPRIRLCRPLPRLSATPPHLSSCTACEHLCSGGETRHYSSG